VNIIINGKDPNYIRPLDKDINDVFDKAKIRPCAILRSPAGFLRTMMAKPIGRIAAFVNKKYKNRGDEMPTGRNRLF
jgi:hypothetical protein